jgi:probable phosphoglycerate mutase
MRRVTLIRHAETDANAAGVWQGSSSASLSETGRLQAKRLREALGQIEPTRAVASDLSRTLETAGVAGLEVTPDPRWREMDIGRWEGLTREEVAHRYPEEMDTLRRGGDVRMGGGETWSELAERVRAVFTDLVDSMLDGEHAVVITHGGVIHTLVAALIGTPVGTGVAPIDRVRNASMTELLIHERTVLARFNAGGDSAGVPQERTSLVLIRHGESEANVRGEWHGRTDGPLSELGLRQAEGLVSRVPPVHGVYSSPSARARGTAGPLAAALGLDIAAHPGLAEMDIGEWEGLTYEEILEVCAELWGTIQRDFVDLPRGHTGETMAATAARGRAAVDEIAHRHQGQRVAVVTHGMLIRALVGDVLGVGWPGSESLAIPSNASVTHLRFAARGPVLVDYNV